MFRTADYRTLTYHGGALEVARQLAPGAPEPWIDLSTGINPHAYPLPDLAPDTWSRLPESSALARLEAAAAQAEPRRSPSYKRDRREIEAKRKGACGAARREARLGAIEACL